MTAQTAPSKIFTVNEVELTYKTKHRLDFETCIRSSRDAEKILRHFWDESKIEFIEEFVMLFLNTSNKVTGIYRVSTGGSKGTVVDRKIVLAAAIKSLAQGVILCHNHPSGNLEPSGADCELTRILKTGFEYMDIALCDHIILAPESGRYYSFADEGRM